VLGQSGRVADGGADQAAPPQPFDDAIPIHLAVSEARLQQPGRHAVGRQQQGEGQFLGRADYVTGDDAGSQAVDAAVGEDDLAELQAEKLAGRAAEAVKAVSGVEPGWEQLRRVVEPTVDELPDAAGVAPNLVVERSRHGKDDLFGAAGSLQRGRFSFTIHESGVRSHVHLGILSCDKKKDDRDAGDRTPGASQTCNPVESGNLRVRKARLA